MEIELDIECSNCDAAYTMMYESDAIPNRHGEQAYHCSFCGILMESYQDEIEE
jgi:DNA-directed RNA polymerase subunit RPC12/RpoP